MRLFTNTGLRKLATMTPYPYASIVAVLSVVLSLSACAGVSDPNQIPRPFLPPTIIIHEAPPDLPDSARHYLGVWEFDGILPGHSHPYRNIIAVTGVDSAGAVCLRQLSNTPITFKGPRWFSNFKRGQIDTHGIRFNSGIVDEWLVAVDPDGAALAAYVSEKSPAGQRSFSNRTGLAVYHKMDVANDPSLPVRYLPYTKTAPLGSGCAE